MRTHHIHQSNWERRGSYIRTRLCVRGAILVGLHSSIQSGEQQGRVVDDAAGQGKLCWVQHPGDTSICRALSTWEDPRQRPNWCVFLSFLPLSQKKLRSFCRQSLSKIKWFGIVSRFSMRDREFLFASPSSQRNFPGPLCSSFPIRFSVFDYFSLILSSLSFILFLL